MKGVHFFRVLRLATDVLGGFGAIVCVAAGVACEFEFHYRLKAEMIRMF